MSFQKCFNKGEYIVSIVDIKDNNGVVLIKKNEVYLIEEDYLPLRKNLSYGIKVNGMVLEGTPFLFRFPTKKEIRLAKLKSVLK